MLLPYPQMVLERMVGHVFAVDTRDFVDVDLTEDI